MGSITHTVEGNIASFVSAGKADIQSLKCYFEPIQEGEGDPSPTNIRSIIGYNSLTCYKCGKNLLNEQFLSNLENYPISGAYTYKYTEPIFLLPNTTYTIWFTNSVRYDTIRYWALKIYDNKYDTYDSPGTVKYLINSTYRVNTTFTTGIQGVIRFAVFGEQSTLDDIWSNVNVQMELGSSATTYEPYRGQTIPITFPVVGKNKFDEIYENINNNLIYRSIYVGNIMVTASTTAPRNMSNWSNLFILSGQVTSGASTGTNDFYLEHPRTITNPINGYITIAYRNMYDIDPNNYQTMIEYGSTATTYEPYSSDNTVYGGYVDLITGEVYQEWRKIKVADLTWSNYTGKISYYAAVTKGLTGSYRQQNTYIYSDTVPMRTIGGHLNADAGQITYNGESTTTSSDKNNVWIMLPEAMEQQEAQAWIAEQYPNAYLCYKLETPILIGELNPTELQTFVGRNNIWSNANDKVSITYDIHETSQIIEAKKQIIKNEPHLASASGNIATFNTDMVAPLKSAKFYFNPIQEGSGDPSPENVRAISGWTGLSLLQYNKNILDPSIRKDNYGFVQSFGGNAQGTTNGDLILPAGTYTFSTNGPTQMISIYKKGGNFVATSQSTAVTFTLNETTEIEIIYINPDSSYNYQLEVGSIATEYVPYNAQTIPIDWTSTAGTLYGGYIDIVTGKLVATYSKVNLGDYTWNKIGQNTLNAQNLKNIYFYVATPTIISNNNRYSTPSDSFCSSFPFIIRQEMYYTENTKGIAFDNGAVYIAWSDFDNYTTTEFKSAMDGIYLVAPLVIPIEYQLTPQQLTTLRGINNIYSSANGTVDIKYWKH